MTHPTLAKAIEIVDGVAIYMRFDHKADWLATCAHPEITEAVAKTLALKYHLPITKVAFDETHQRKRPKNIEPSIG